MPLPTAKVNVFDGEDRSLLQTVEESDGKMMSNRSNKVEEARVEANYFKRRFFQARQSQMNFERLLLTDQREDMMWKLYDVLSTPPEALKEFGLGFGIFFDHLSCLGVCASVLTIVSFCWNSLCCSSIRPSCNRNSNNSDRSRSFSAANADGS